MNWHELHFLFERSAAKAIFFLLLALAFVCCAWFSRYRDSLLAEEGVQVEGRIVDMKRRFWARRHSRPNPIVEFIDADGTKRRVVTKNSSECPALDPVGNRVTILYARGNPDVAEISAFHDDSMYGRTTLLYRPRPHPDYAGMIYTGLAVVTGIMALYHFSGPARRYLGGDREPTEQTNAKSVAKARAALNARRRRQS